MTLLRIRNPVAFEVPSIRSLFLDGLAKTPSLPPAEGILEVLPKLVTREDFLALVTRHEDASTGFALAMAPTSPLANATSLYAFHATTTASRKSLADGVVLWSRQRGVLAVDTMNLNVGRDRAFLRLFRGVGHAEPIGTVFRFHI